MSRALAIGLGLAGLAAQALLLAEAGASLPGPVRLAVAFAVLVLSPGWAFVTLGARPPGGLWLAGGWAFGFGVAWISALVLVVHLAGLSFLTLETLTLPASAALWGLVAWRASPTPAGGASGLPRWAALAVLLAAALAAWHVGRVGPPMTLTSDTPDHVGTLRRMLEAGQPFPTDAFFRNAGHFGADPRKGLWHAVVALVTRLAGLDPVESWRWLGAFVAPLFVMTVAALGLLCRGPVGAVLAAWTFLLAYGASMASSPIRTMTFSVRVCDQLGLATAVAVLADLRSPARARRLAAAGLGFSAVATHVFAAIQFAWVFPALALGLVVRDRRLGPELRRLVPTVLLIAMVCLPYLLWRAGQAYAPANIIHTEPQGLLYLTDSLRVASIDAPWAQMGWVWLLVPLAGPWLWTRGRANPAVLYLLTSSLVVALSMYFPPVVAILQPRLGYLLMRLILFVPFTGVVAWLLPELWAAVRKPGCWRPRAAAAAMLALALGLFWPAVRDAAQVLVAPQLITQATSQEDPRRWQDVFDWMNQHLEPDCVVLSDMATSYMVPMMTGRYVVTIMDQHSSPNDSLALRRILDARDALDPFESWSRVRAVVRRYGVNVIVLDGRIGERPPILYWAPSREWFAGARVRFDSAPAAFERLADLGDVLIYRVHPAVLDTLAGAPAPRPFVRPAKAGSLRELPPVAPGLPAIAGFALHPAVVQPGDTLRGFIDWHGQAELPPGSYRVAVRFDCALPPGWKPPAVFMKPFRKLLELQAHKHYRFRADHLPASGVYGVDLWRPEEVVRDEFALVVPPDVAAGDYVVRVRMIRTPQFANLRLSDYFFDQDYFAGQAVGQVRLVVPPASGVGEGTARVRH